MSRPHGALIGMSAAVLTVGALAVASLRAAGPGPAPVHLKVLYVRYLSAAPLAIAEAEGYFRAQGLEIEPITLTGSSEATPALIRGELDVVSGLIKIGDFNAMARGAGVRIVADKGHFEPGPCTPMAFVARRGFLDAGGADDPARLRGARIAASPLSYVEYALETLFNRRGLKLADMNLARIHERTVAEAIASGSLDIGLLAEPDLSRALKSGKTALWMPFQEILPGAQMSAIYFGPGLLERNRDAGRRFMVAYLQGVRQYNLGKTPRNLDILASTTGLDRELLKEACWQPMRGDGKINVESVLDFQRWAVVRGALDSVVPPGTFWDPSFVEAADRILGSPAR